MLRKKNKGIFIILLLLLLSITSIVTWAVRSNPTEPISYVMIQSDNYNNPGSWKIKKSSSWISKNKAKITFELETIPKTNNHKKDVVFVIDTSDSLNNDEKSDTLKKALKRVINYILTDSNNKVALITFNSSSEVLSDFTNNYSNLSSYIDEINATGDTNYNAALLNVENIINDYEIIEDRDLVVVFFTDGKPTVDTPKQIVTHELLKEKYPFLKINGIQYKASNTVMDELAQITDEQFIADKLGLYDTFLKASVEPYNYDSFIIDDYIESLYFETAELNSIYTSVGNINLSNEDGKEKVTWSLGDDFFTGRSAQMSFYVNMKNDYKNVPNLYPTNNYAKISYQLDDENITVKESDLTPVLKNYYTVSYDNNLPNGCSISNFQTEEYSPFSNVTIRQDKLSCEGYNFNGWEIVNDDVLKVGDDNFIMPESDVTIKATWSRPGITKTMDGTIHQRTTLYRKLRDDALNTNTAATYSGNVNDGGGNETIYYSTNSDNHNVSFAGYCWEIIRTTDTGGVKLQLKGGLSSNGTCTSSPYYIGVDGTNNILDLTNTSYAYGTSYNYNETTRKFTISGEVDNYSWSSQSNNIIGKYTCKNNDSSTACSDLTYVSSILDVNNANIMVLKPVQNGIGTSSYNTNYKSLASVGYMYNDNYDFDTKNMASNNVDVIYKSSFDKTFYIASNFNLNGTDYQLYNPYLIDDADFDNEDLSSLVGKYTIRNQDDLALSNSIYYIIATEGTDIYYLLISNGENLATSGIDIYFSDEIVNNGNNTYTLSGNISSINKLNWYTNYNNSTDLYTCFSNSQTCSAPYYITNSSKTNFTYEDGTKNYVYGNDFDYDNLNSKYILKDTITFNSFTKNYNRISNHHYTCFNTSGQCQTLAYIYYVKDENTPMFIYLNNNESVEDAINNMLYSANVNNKNSIIKSNIEWWFQERFSKYENYLEDVIYCNDRSTSSLGGWDPNSGVISFNDQNVFLKFNNYNLNSMISNINLYCQNEQDRFTKSSDKGNGKLSYPIGLLSIQEAFLTLNLQSEDQFYLSPMLFDNQGAKVSTYNTVNEKLNYNSVTQNKYILPVISLKPGTEFTTGNGSIDAPYYVPTEYD